MKKITITTLLLAIFICSQAQEAKDETKTSKFVLGGNFSFDYSVSQIKYNLTGEVEDEKATSSLISFMPYIGVNIGKKTAIGLKLGFTHYNDYFKETRDIVDPDYYGSKIYTVASIKGTEYTLSPYFRYTNDFKNSQLNYFFELSAGIGISSNMEAEIGDDEYYPYRDYDFTKYFMAVDAGLLYQFTNKIGVEFNISFFSITFLDEDFEDVIKNKTLDIKLMPELFKPNIGVNLNF
jgi:hypothetical protein